jgi:small conductance mechanosensitive channel
MGTVVSDLSTGARQYAGGSCIPASHQAFPRTTPGRRRPREGRLAPGGAELLRDAEVSDQTVTALITAGVGIVIVLIVRWVVKHALDRYLKRAEERRSPDEVASLRTRLTVLLRAGVVFFTLIIIWQVLSIYDQTEQLAKAVLASGAVVALFVGLAFSTPLSNLGAGILLAFTQPVRIGDRVTVGEATGTAEQITMIHTVLVSDDDRRMYIPNSQMVSSVVVNRSVVDPRRSVTVELPIAMTASLERAKSAMLDAARHAAGADQLELDVRLGTVGEKTAWLTLTALAPRGTNVAALGAELRERALEALAREQLLPT